MSAPVGRWQVDIKGIPCQVPFEIAVTRADNDLGLESFGWFGEHKLLISHDGGPCTWPVIPLVWDSLVELAHEVANRLNSDDSSDA